MKFAALALVAVASGIKIQGGPPCPLSMNDTDEVFGELDTNHNGQISGRELEAGLREAVKHGALPAGLADHIDNIAGKYAGSDHQLDHAEFNKLANAAVCHA